MEIKKTVIQKISVQTAELAYCIFGTGKINLVIEMGLGAVMAEWRPLAERLAKHHTVLLYERAGYGSSSASTLKRTPEHIADELYRLLQQLDCEEKITLLAHSQGGLYAQQFARIYPQHVRNMVLLDPLSPHDSAFQKELTDAEFQKSGVDKTAGLRLNLRLTRLHLGWFVRLLMKSAPPFYYYPEFTKEETRSILSAISRPQIYETALAEYELAHQEQYLQKLRSPVGFPQLPLILVTHDSGIEEQEIRTFGGASEEEAAKIETLWQRLMCEYLAYSEKSVHIRASQSSHFIHLTDMDLICEWLEKSAL
ncbi:MAG: alpha/beta fold hydrolase [Lachnospiraceae bacterium]|nr:alpha/beta fold hydrolase [Lachnospiraceae bacterium]